MYIIKNVQDGLEMTGGVRSHLMHPLSCQWKGHDIHISHYHKKCFIRAIFHATVFASGGILAISVKLLSYRKVTVIALSLISTATFGISYILQTLAWKVDVINKLKKHVPELTSSEEISKTDKKESELTPLQKACLDDDADLAMKLLEEGEDPSVCLDHGENAGANALHFAVCPKDEIKFLPIIEKILQKCPKLLNQLTCEGLTPLHYTVMGFNLPLVVEKLLSYGADVNVVSKEGLTALDYICGENHYHGDLEKGFKRTATIIELLLGKGAQFSKYKEGPLQMDLEFLHRNHHLKDESLISLYQLGLSKPVKDKYGNMIIHHACYWGRPNLVKWLIENENMASYLYQSNKHFDSPFSSLTMLCEWMYEGKEEIISYLLDKNLIPKEKKEELFIRAILAGYHKIIEKMKEEFQIDVKREFWGVGDRGGTLECNYPFNIIMNRIENAEPYFTPKLWILVKENYIKMAKVLMPTDESLIPDKIKALALKHSI